MLLLLRTSSESTNKQCPQPKVYDAQVRQETFDVQLKVSTEDGRLLSAHMENPVKVLERHCKDAALTDCSEPTQFGILRQISIQ